MKRAHLFIIGVLLSVLIGCAGIQTSKICTNIPEGETSVLCEIATKVGTTPENVGAIVMVADLLLLDETHSAQEAWDFFTALEEAAQAIDSVSGQVSYADLVGHAAVKYFELPPKVQAAIVIIKQFYDVDSELSVKILSDYDWLIIQTALAEQKAAIKPFI